MNLGVSPVHQVACLDRITVLLDALKLHLNSRHFLHQEGEQILVFVSPASLAVGVDYIQLSKNCSKYRTFNSDNFPGALLRHPTNIAGTGLSCVC